jgi:hypothetical protein
VPWCPYCDRFLSQPTVKTDGTCPGCGRAVEATSVTTDDEAVPFPWHLKLLAGAVALYLGFRAWQGIEWILHRF